MPVTRKILEMLRSGELESRYANLLRVSRHDRGLVLLNYTDACQHARAWDDVTTACRGLILDPATGEVVARPFPKFFNWGEQDVKPIAGPVLVTEKVDGSMGILYRLGDELALATRGAFASREAQRGTAMLRALPGVREVPHELTLLFEIVTVDGGSNMVKYDYEGLVLLGAVDRFTGAELPHPEVVALAGRLGVRTPIVFPHASLDEALTARVGLPANFEGFVVRFADGLRLKLKGEAYLAALRASAALSTGKVRDALAAGEAAYRALELKTPEELRPDLERVAGELRARAEALRTRAEQTFARAPQGADRRSFAVWVQQNAADDLRGAMFKLLDGRAPNWYTLLD